MVFANQKVAMQKSAFGDYFQVDLVSKKKEIV